MKLRFELYAKQLGLCWWCDCQMVAVVEGKKLSWNSLTLDHVYSRLDPRRKLDKTSVAACNRCNQRRSREDLQAFKAENRRRSLAKKVRREKRPIDWMDLWDY